MNSGQVVDCLVLFFLNLILESRRKMETVHSRWCTWSLIISIPTMDFALLRTQTYLLTTPRMLSPANSP